MDITSTAQALKEAQALSQSMGGYGKLLIAALVGFAGSIPAQAIIEHLTAGPKVPALLKAMAPTILALVAGMVAVKFGVTPEQAVAAAAALAPLTHLVNESSIAADSEYQAPVEPKP